MKSCEKVWGRAWARLEAVTCSSNVEGNTMLRVKPFVVCGYLGDYWAWQSPPHSSLSLNICFLTHCSPYKGGPIVQLKVLFSFLEQVYSYFKVQPLLLLVPQLCNETWTIGLWHILMMDVLLVVAFCGSVVTFVSTFWAFEVCELQQWDHCCSWLLGESSEHSSTWPTLTKSMQWTRKPTVLNWRGCWRTLFVMCLQNYIQTLTKLMTILAWGCVVF